MIIFIVAGHLAIKCYTGFQVACTMVPISEVSSLLALGLLELVTEVYKAVKIFRKKD